MNIVVLVGNYYPDYEAVGRCAKNIVDVLNGEHQVTVIALETHNSLSSEVACSLDEHVVYVSSKLTHIRNLLNCNRRAHGDSKFKYLSERFLAGVNYCKTIFGRTPCHRSEVKACLNAMCDLDQAPDQVISFSAPFEYAVAGMEYKKQHPEVVFTPVIFDQFADSATLFKSNAQRKLKYNDCIALEREVASLANRVFNVTWDAHVARYMPDFANKFIHIEHPLLLESSVSWDGSVDVASYAVFAGTVYSGVRNPRHTLELFQSLKSSNEIDLVLRMYAMGADVGLIKEAAAHAPEAIQYCDPVPASEVPRIYSGASLLVSIGNSTVDQRPSKTIEYFATGKPVVHIASLRDDPTAREVEAYPLGLVLYEGDGIGANLEKLIAFCRETKGKRVSFEAVASLYADRTPEHVAAQVVGEVVPSRAVHLPLTNRPTC